MCSPAFHFYRSNTHDKIACLIDAGNNRHRCHSRLRSGASLPPIRNRSGRVLVAVCQATGCRFGHGGGRIGRLRRCSHQRGRTPVGAGVERITADFAATSVRGIRDTVCFLRSGVFPRLGRTGSADPGVDRHQNAPLRRDAGSDDLDGRPPAPSGLCATHVGRIFDGQI